MSLDTLRDHVSENSRGIFADFVFAVVWVTFVTVLSDFLDAPTTAYYLLMLAGIPAYYALFVSLDVVKETD
jgi:hypothetical protein